VCEVRLSLIKAAAAAKVECRATILTAGITVYIHYL